MATEAQMLRQLRAAAEQHRALEAKAAEAKARRDAIAYAVRTQHATTYKALSEAIGVGKDRIAQVLREQRQANTAT
jgi:hypothetical protein